MLNDNTSGHLRIMSLLFCHHINFTKQAKIIYILDQIHKINLYHLYLDLDMVTCLWYNHDPRCKEHPCLLSPHLGLWRMLEVTDWGLASGCWFGCGSWCLIEPWSKFLLFFYFEGAKNIHVLEALIVAFEDTGGFWLGFRILSILSLVLIHPCSKFQLCILILKVQRTSMSFMS